MSTTVSPPDGTRPAAELLGLRADAPVLVRFEAEVAASPEAVWELLTAVERWPLWHRGVDFAVLKAEEARPGVRLQWRADGMRISSILHEVEPGARLSWTLRTLGARGYQRWTIEPMTGGRTRVRTEESWWGFFPFVLRGTLRKTLRASRAAWLRGLKDRLEGP